MTGSDTPQRTRAAVPYFTDDRLLNMLAVKMLIKKHSDEAPSFF